MFSKIVTICTGNICRSPMLEYMLRAQLGERYSVESAGINAVRGGSAHKFTQAVMADHGFDLSMHVGRQVMADILSRNDLVLAMDNEHVQWLHSSFPSARGRIFLSGHWCGQEEVPDPVREPRPAFEAVYGMLSEHVASWKKQL